MIKRIPFVEWAPDSGEIGSPEGIAYIVSGYPSTNGYRPIGKAATTHTLVQNELSPTNTPINGASFECGGTKYTFIAGQRDIFRLSATSTVDNVSAGATTTPSTFYSVADPKTGAWWDFTKWEDRVFAVSRSELMQSMTADGAVMLPSATSTPKAQTIETIRDFLVVGNTHDPTDGTVTNRVRWSAFQDPDDWVVSAVTQSDYEDLKGSGDVLRIFGGEYGIVMCDNSIWRMSYVGTPVVWRFDEVQHDLGLISSGAAAQVGDRIFFMSRDGFCVLVNGSHVERIGRNRVDETVLNDLSPSIVGSITCAADPRFQRVFWTYPYFPADSSGDRNRTVIYDYGIDKWSSYSNAIVNSERVMANGRSIWIPVLNDVHNNQIGLVFADGGGSNNQALLLLQSATSTATVRTSRLELTPGRSSLVKSVIVGRGKSRAPIFAPKIKNSVSVWGMKSPSRDSDDVTADGRTRTSEDAAFTTDAKLRHSVRANGRFHQFEITTEALSDSSDFIDEIQQISYIDVEFESTHWR